MYHRNDPLTVLWSLFCSALGHTLRRVWYTFGTRWEKVSFFRARMAVISSFGKKTPLGGDVSPTLLRSSIRLAHFCINWEWCGDSCCTWCPGQAVCVINDKQNRTHSVLGFRAARAWQLSEDNSAVCFRTVKSRFVPRTLHFRGHEGVF